jgi:hypothetical protein
MTFISKKSEFVHLPATRGPLHIPTRSLKSLKQSRLIPSNTAIIAKANSANATIF